MSLLKPEWLPACEMRRIIVHWTGGTWKASLLDRRHYHLVVEGDGTVLPGKPISANVPPLKEGVYAAHTRGCNSHSIGVAACAMVDAEEHPFDPGRCPMTPKQWETMAAVAAELCAAYRIEVTPKTVLGHCEVQAVLNIPQRGKWDPGVLPWNLSEPEPMKRFREKVREALAHA